MTSKTHSASSRPMIQERPAARTHRTRRFVIDVVFALLAVVLFLALMNTGALVSFADWFGHAFAHRATG